MEKEERQSMRAQPRRIRMHWRIRGLCGMAAVLVLLAPADATDKKPKSQTPSALDKYLQEALKDQPAPPKPSPGSLWSPASRLTDLGADVRAVQIDDLVTVVVSENASAVATGATKTSRTSSANASVTAL